MVTTLVRRDVTEILTDLVVGADLITALLVTRDGHRIADAGDTRDMDTTALAALVAGMFAATREVARLVGEDQFSILLQQGERRHLHISLVSDGVMMVLVFEDYQKIGRVRYEARKVQPLINASMREEPVSQPVIPEAQKEVTLDQFREYALNLIDRIFEAR